MSFLTDPEGNIYLEKISGSAPPNGKFYATDANQIRAGMIEMAVVVQDLSSSIGTVAELSGAVTASNATVAGVSASLTATNANVASLSASLTDTRATLVSVSSSLTASQTTLLSVSSSLTATQATLMSVSASLTATRATLTIVSSSLTGTQATLTSVSSSLSSTQASFNSVSSSYYILSQSYTGTVGTLNSVSQSLTATISSLNSVSSSLTATQTSLNSVSSSYYILSQSYTGSKANITEISNSLTATITRLDAVSSSYYILSQSYTGSKASITEISNSLTATISKLDAVSSSYYDLSQSNVGVSSSLTATISRLNSVSSSYYELSMSYTGTKSTLTNVSNSLNTTNATVAVMSSSILNWGAPKVSVISGSPGASTSSVIFNVYNNNSLIVKTSGVDLYPGAQYNAGYTTFDPNLIYLHGQFYGDTTGGVDDHQVNGISFMYNDLSGTNKKIGVISSIVNSASVAAPYSEIDLAVCSGSADPLQSGIIYRFRPEGLSIFKVVGGATRLSIISSGSAGAQGDVNAFKIANNTIEPFVIGSPNNLACYANARANVAPGTAAPAPAFALYSHKSGDANPGAAGDGAKLLFVGRQSAGNSDITMAQIEGRWNYLSSTLEEGALVLRVSTRGLSGVDQGASLWVLASGVELRRGSSAFDTVLGIYHSGTVNTIIKPSGTLTISGSVLFERILRLGDYTNSSPTDGDVWRSGTNFYARVTGTTYKFTLAP